MFGGHQRVRERTRALGAAVTFDPSDLTGYRDHGIDAGLTRSGGKISKWTGEAGAVVLAQATADNQPADTTILNSHVTATFDGTNDWLGSDEAGGSFGAAFTQPFTIYLVLKLNSADPGLLCGHDGPESIIIQRATSPNDWLYKFGGTSRRGGAPDTNWHRHIIHADGANSYWDIDESTVLSGASPGTDVIDSFRLANWQGDSVYGALSVATWALHDAAPSAQDKTDMWAWMATYGGL